MRHLFLQPKRSLPPPQGGIIMILEIGYTLQLDKESKKQDSWTYYHTDTDDFAKAVKEASRYFKTFVKDNGWQRKAKVKSIIKIRHANEHSN